MLTLIELTTGIKRKVYIVSVLLILMAVILEIWTVNRLSTFGQELGNLESSKSQLTLENQVLRDKIAQESSLSQIEKESHDLGLGQAKAIQYLKPSNLASAARSR